MEGLGIIRGFVLDRRETRTIDITEPGEHIITE